MVTLPNITDPSNLWVLSEAAAGESSLAGIGDSGTKETTFAQALSATFSVLKDRNEGREKGQPDGLANRQGAMAAMTSFMSPTSSGGEEQSEAIPADPEEGPEEGCEGETKDGLAFPLTVSISPAPAVNEVSFSWETQQDTLPPEKTGSEGPLLKETLPAKTSDHGGWMTSPSIPKGAEGVSSPAAGQPPEGAAPMFAEQDAMLDKKTGVGFEKEAQGPIAIALKNEEAPLFAFESEGGAWEGKEGAENSPPKHSLGGEGLTRGEFKGDRPLDPSEGPPVKGPFASAAFPPPGVEGKGVDLLSHTVMAENLKGGRPVTVRVLSLAREQGPIQRPSGVVEGPSAGLTGGDEASWMAKAGTFSDPLGEMPPSPSGEGLSAPTVQGIPNMGQSGESIEAENPLASEKAEKTPSLFLEIGEAKAEPRALPRGKGKDDEGLLFTHREGKEILSSPVPKATEAGDADFSINKETEISSLNLPGKEAGASLANPGETIKESSVSTLTMPEAVSFSAHDNGPGKTDGLAFPPLAMVKRSLEGLLFPERSFQIRHHDGTTVGLVLDPEGLGQVEVELTLTRDLLQGQITVQDPRHKEWIEGNLPILMSDLAREGLQVGGFTVALKQRDQGFLTREDEPQENERDPSLPALLTVPERPNGVNRVHIIV